MALSAEGANANGPRVAVDPQGDAVAVWERPNEEGEEVIEAATKPASASTWSKSVGVSNPAVTKEPASQQVAIDGQGDVVVVWSWLEGGKKDVVEATEGKVSSSVWKASVILSPLGGNTEEENSGGRQRSGQCSSGLGTLQWHELHRRSRVRPCLQRVVAATGAAVGRGPGSWRTAGCARRAGQRRGCWSRFDGKASYLAEAAGYDAAGPELNSLTIPTTGAVGQTLAFSATPFDIWSGLGATSWSFGDGTSQTGTSVTHAYGAAGTYTVTLTSADVLGNTSSTSGTVQITAPATSIKPPVVVPVAPKITGAHLTATRFRVSAHATAISAKAKAPRGTSFHFTVSEAAKLKVAFQRSAAGLRSGKRCLAPSAKLRRAHAKRCKRTVTVGTLTRTVEPAVADSLGFSGRIGTKPLAPGSYKAILTASAGGLSSTPVTLSFTVVS